jgi:hypothetical protein
MNVPEYCESFVGKQTDSLFASALVLAAWLTSVISSSCCSQTVLEQVGDPLDGKFDVGQATSTNQGFLPVPMVITEPAVGFGLGGGLLYFHQGSDQQEFVIDSNQEGGRMRPHSMSGVFGLGTDNDTWAGAGFHFGSWYEDTIRYAGAAGMASVNLKSYGGGDSPSTSDGLNYNLKGWLLFQQLMFRVSDTDAFVGGRFTYFDSHNTFDLASSLPGIEQWEIDSDNVGLGPVVQYDSLDNIFTPNRGTAVDYSTMFFAGSGQNSREHEYQITGVKYRRYWSLTEEFVLGWRLRGEFSSGNVLFYAMPFVDLRGIPALRYQDTHAISTELEARLDVSQRWSVVGFAGTGCTANSLGDFRSAKGLWTGGVGVRYLTIPKLGLYTGLDVAAGPEDVVFYLQSHLQNL